MKYLLLVVVLVTAFVTCDCKLNDGPRPPAMEYEVTGSDSFSVIEGTYLVPGTDSTAQIFETSLPWGRGLDGNAGDSVAISVRGYNPTATPGTLVVRIFVGGKHLVDSPNNPDSCVTHQFPGQDTCWVESGGRL